MYFSVPAERTQCCISEHLRLHLTREIASHAVLGKEWQPWSEGLECCQLYLRDCFRDFLFLHFRKRRWLWGVFWILMTKDSWTMTTDISLLFEEFKLFQEEMIVNSCRFRNTGCPPIRFPRLQRSIVFPVLNGCRFEIWIETCKEKPAKKKTKPSTSLPSFLLPYQWLIQHPFTRLPQLCLLTITSRENLFVFTT